MSYFDNILAFQIQQWRDEFSKKQSDYASTGGNLANQPWGIFAQYIKMNDKLAKLRRSLYEGEILREAKAIDPEIKIKKKEYIFEDEKEMLQDLIGHAFLTLAMIQQREACQNNPENSQGV